MSRSASDTATTGAARISVLTQVLTSLAVLGVFAGAGAGAGWLWERWWTPTRGVVIDGTWIAGYRPQGDVFVFDFPSLQGFFDATAQYVVIGVVAGLVLGVAVGLLGRGSELLMLAVVVVGSVLAGWIAYRLGGALGPVDPTTLESAASDGTTLPASLMFPGTSPFIAWPLGALMGLGVTYFLTSAASDVRRRESEDPRWLERPTWLDEGSAGTTTGTASS